MYAVSRHDTVVSLVAPGTAAMAPRFTALEQRVLHLAASGSERPSTTVEPLVRRLGRRIGNFMMARRGGRELADPRLEALRSYAAAVRLGKSDGLAVFHAAGYTGAQAQAVKQFVAEAVRTGRRTSAARDRIVYVSGLSIGLGAIAGFFALTGSLLIGL